ncbi:MAG: ribosome biogenesis GTPase Der [Pseudomonadota bacterium]
MVDIIIVGRSNVGKSAMFNLFSCGYKKSIVSDQENLTRDLQRTSGALIDLCFNIIDTPGISYDHLLSQHMNKNVRFAAVEADIIFFVVDGNCGITNDDMKVFNELKSLRQKMILIVNKCDTGPIYEHNFRVLGIENIFYISVIKKYGFDELYDYLLNKQLQVKDQKKPVFMRLAVIGKPNVGKSSYMNLITGKDSSVVSEVAGTTRDSIDQYWTYKNNNILITDTAGIYKNKSQSYIDKIAVKCTEAVIKYANVVLLVVDAYNLFGKNDWRILNHVISEGRGIVIVVNKCDLIDKEQLNDKVVGTLKNNNIYDIPIFYISVKKKSNIFKPIDKALRVFKMWQMKFKTSQLNNWLREAVSMQKHKLIDGIKPVRLKYITQVYIKPITCKIFCNVKPTDKNYISYLSKHFCRYFNLSGFSIRFIFEAQDTKKHSARKKS